MLFGRQRRHVKRILIVEDEPLVAFDNEVMVEGAGYTVVATVCDFDDALAVLTRELAPLPDDGSEDDQAAERGIDLVLTDITLSGERSGMDLAAEARRMGIPVLFATANPPDRENELALGVLLKPYNDRRLRAALKTVEQVLAGKAKVSVPEGMILFEPKAAA